MYVGVIIYEHTEAHLIKQILEKKNSYNLLYNVAW